ncbi:MAG: hypothetical protein WB762_03450 [Candidatus Sulfotelmatobacter sp.]
MGEWEQRNRKLAGLREALQRSPADLDLANRYWRALAGDRAKNEADYRSGRDVIEAYREAALLSKKGVEAFACAFQELFHISGEIPRMAFFDEPLVLSLKAKLPEMGETDRRNVEWILHSIGSQISEGH